MTVMRHDDCTTWWHCTWNSIRTSWWCKVPLPMKIKATVSNSLWIRFSYWLNVSVLNVFMSSCNWSPLYTCVCAIYMHCEIGSPDSSFKSGCFGRVDLRQLKLIEYVRVRRCSFYLYWLLFTGLHLCDKCAGFSCSQARNEDTYWNQGDRLCA